MQSQHRIDIRTLAIASVASAAAAAITSQIWFRGTPFAAALTPVVITLVSQMLHRPADRIAQRLATESDALPEAAGAEPPPTSQEVASEPAPDPAAEAAPDPAVPVEGRRRRKIAWGAALVTGLLAFAIAAVAMSVPELITGQSLFHSDRRTTLGGAKVMPSDNGPSPSQPADEPEGTETREPDEDTPEDESEPPPDETTEDEPTETTPTDDTTEPPPSGTIEPPGSGAIEPPGTGGALAPTAE